MKMRTLEYSVSAICSVIALLVAVVLLCAVPPTHASTCYTFGDSEASVTYIADQTNYRLGLDGEIKRVNRWHADWLATVDTERNAQVAAGFFIGYDIPLTLEGRGARITPLVAFLTDITGDIDGNRATHVFVGVQAALRF